MELLSPSPKDTLLDCGCGTGDWTMLFARTGAKIYAIDRSNSAIEVLHRRLDRFGLHAELHCGDITKMPYPNRTFTKVFGSMILHHMKDFQAVGRELGRVLQSGGKAVFWENSANNPILMFARNYIVGRYGIPKFGDYEEHPLRRSSIETMAAEIGHFKIYFNQCVFFRVFDVYITRGKWKPVTDLCYALDRLMWKTPLRRFGYLQIVEFQKQ